MTWDSYGNGRILKSGLWESLGCCFLGFGHVRTPCIQPVYLGAPYAFSIKFYITYQKKKKKSEIVLGHKID
jgi:hypothetical protein